MKLLCDEIFGERNFIASLPTIMNLKGNQDQYGFAGTHEFTFVYAKNKSNLNLGYLQLDEEEADGWEQDKIGYFKRGANLKSTGINAPREKRPNLGELPSKRPKSTFYKPEYSSGNGTNQMKQIFGSKIFETPKPFDLIHDFLQISTDKNSIILDSFAGSGTTAHAILNLNKQNRGHLKFILVEMEDYANTITAERVKRIMKGYGEGKKAVEGTGGAFDFYALGLPLFDENHNLNEEVGLPKIREYIWFSETRTSLNYDSRNAYNYYLGSKDGTAYYFIYEKDRITTLDYDTLEFIKTQCGQLEEHTLGELLERNIINSAQPFSI